MEILQGFGSGIALEVVKGFVLEIIKDVRAEDIPDAIKSNKDLWSISISDERVAPIISRLNPAFKYYLEKFGGLITTETVINWLIKERPDIAMIIINTRGGYDWLSRQVENFKERLKA